MHLQHNQVSSNSVHEVIPTHTKWYHSSNSHMQPSYNESLSTIMSGRTFEQLMKLFYLNDAAKQTNHTKDDYDKIYKIRQLLALVVKVFQSMYVSNHVLSAYDSIIGYKDRFSWIHLCLIKP